MIVSWAIGNNLVYLRGILVYDCDSFLGCIYLREDRSDCDEFNLMYLLGICGYIFIKTNFTRITKNRVSNLHIVHLLRCNSILYFKIGILVHEVLRIL